jgi:hypothetical protein
MMERKIKKFDDLLSQKHIDLEKLRSLSWNGIPSTTPHYRCLVWKLLLDYLPVDTEIHMETIARKRGEYIDMVHHYFGKLEYLNVQDIKVGKGE